MMNSGLCGNSWLATCKKCHIEVHECCIDVELSLFPDEVKEFKEKDPENIEEYEDSTFGYNKPGRCCFLLNDNSCQLQNEGKIKPVDCLIYPVNYKNGSIFLDKSCWALEYISVQEAINYLREKLARYPRYKNIKYDLRESDEFITELVCE